MRLTNIKVLVAIRPDNQIGTGGDGLPLSTKKFGDEWLSIDW